MEYVLLTLYVCALIGSPVLLIQGWVRWSKRMQPRTLPASLSLAGFIFATASALLVVGSLVYSQSIGGFPFYDPRLLRIYRWGLSLSFCGIVFAVGGMWRPGPLRWHAVLCAVGTLVFWVGAAEGE